MQSGLYLTTTVPQITLPDGSTRDDPNYYTVTQLPPGIGAYSQKYVLHAAPGAPPPDQVFHVIQNGNAPWHWLDGSIAADTDALTASCIAFSLWKENDGNHYGTVNQRVNRGGNVTQVLAPALPSHEWFGNRL